MTGIPTKEAPQLAPSTHAATAKPPAPPVAAAAAIPRVDVAAKLREQQEEMERLKQQLLEKAAMVAKQKVCNQQDALVCSWFSSIGQGKQKTCNCEYITSLTPGVLRRRHSLPRRLPSSRSSSSR
jgi:hypothetical protein